MNTVRGFHKPNEVNGYLSNWYLSDFECGGVRFSSMEQYMMYQKAQLFEDAASAQAILATSDVAEIKRLGRSVGGYNETLWNGLRQIVVYEGLLAKFSQNDDLRQQLLYTGDDILAECAVSDPVRGIGLSMTDERRFDLHSWQGKNCLGFALMAVRSKLRNQ